MSEKKAPGTALVQAAEETIGATELTVAQQKKFVELAGRTNLDKLAKPEQQIILIAFGRHTGLRPELGEVMIFQGRFYITIAGMRRNAHRNVLFVGRKPRPAIKQERENAGYEPEDIVWICDIFRRGCTEPFRGWGKVTKAERDAANEYTPVKKHPVEIARKRAEYDGLRAAFPLDEDLAPFARRMIEQAEGEIRESFAQPAIAGLQDAYATATEVEAIEEAAVGEADQ